MSIAIVYVPWSDIDQIECQSGILYSIESQPELLRLGQSLVDTYFNRTQEVMDEFETFKRQLRYIGEKVTIDLLDDPIINDLLVEIEWTIEDEVRDALDYIEAQILTYADLISARIVFLNVVKSCACNWLDPRDIVVSDESWTSADVLTEQSKARAKAISPEGMYITKHGIGATSSNENTRTAEAHYWSKIFN